MSMLQSARQHRAPMHVGNAASAVGLQADQLSTYITDDGRLRACATRRKCATGCSSGRPINGMPS
jgi:hypothetical protein